jgi:hypothetical protein
MIPIHTLNFPFTIVITVTIDAQYKRDNLKEITKKYIKKEQKQNTSDGTLALWFTRGQNLIPPRTFAPLH